MRPAVSLNAPLRIGLLALGDAPRLPLAAVHDALLAANRLLAANHYEVLDIDGAPGDARPWAALFVAAGRLPEPAEAAPDALRAHLALLDPAHGVLAGLDTGSAWLALAGWMAGHRCTLRADAIDALIARWPEGVVTRNVFEIDRTRLSCAHGTAALDMIIAWLGQRHGHWIVQQLAACFGLDVLRTADDRQPCTPWPGVRLPAKVAEAVALMQANIAEPLSANHVAELVGVSRRQLERLFRQHLDALPSRWYLELRLARAQGMLRQSSQSILQIGLSCGFTSGAHFSNAYRSFFGRTPREERTPRLRPAADPDRPAVGAASIDPSVPP